MEKILGILGCGTMGTAISKRVEDIEIGFDRNSAKVETLGLTVAKSVEELVEKSEVVIIAIKPQDFRKMELDCGEKLVISIMAGVALKDLPPRSIRAMPNLGVKVGKGVVGWVAGEEVSEEDKEMARQLFAKMGVETEVKTDAEIDQFASIFGCGPAFFYCFMQTMYEMGQEFGFRESDLRKDLEMLIQGSLEVSHGQDFSQLTASVASKGGMTEAGLKVLGTEWSDKLKDALRRSEERAKELSTYNDTTKQRHNETTS